MKAKKGRRWVRPLIISVVVIVAVVTALLILAGRGNQVDWTEAYRRTTVQAVVFQDVVEVSGNIEPLRARDLAFPVAGKVVTVAAEEGESVSRGALLARLDDRAARYELSAVEANLERIRVAGSSRELQLQELERDIKAQAV